MKQSYLQSVVPIGAVFAVFPVRVYNAGIRRCYGYVSHRLATSPDTAISRAQIADAITSTNQYELRDV